MPFKDTPEGQTHSFEDGCKPPHVMPTPSKCNTNCQYHLPPHDTYIATCICCQPKTKDLPNDTYTGSTQFSDIKDLPNDYAPGLGSKETPPMKEEWEKEFRDRFTEPGQYYDFVLRPGNCEEIIRFISQVESSAHAQGKREERERLLEKVEQVAETCCSKNRTIDINILRQIINN